MRADCPEDLVVKVRMRKEILLPLWKWGTGTDGERNQGQLGMCKVYRQTVRSAGSNTEMGTENPRAWESENLKSALGLCPTSCRLLATTFHPI